jgi:hypothetical protein
LFVPGKKGETGWLVVGYMSRMPSLYIDD